MVTNMNYSKNAAKKNKNPQKSRAGLFLGLILGSILAFSAFPSVRDTFIAQFLFTIQQNTLPWMRGFEEAHNRKEVSRLNQAAADASSDYLVQVGRATALASQGGLKQPVIDPHPTTNGPNYWDRTLYRLYRIPLEFPTFPGGYAHLSRYMMSDRVRILRTELSAPKIAAATPASSKRGITSEITDSSLPLLNRSIPARIRDVKLMEWAILAGQKRDPQNAFWPAMLATTYFSAERDSDGLRALAGIHNNSRWDAYIYEEVLGQWKLYSQAYGDNGAAQKIGPLSLVAFPHLREIRHMAELARWHADMLQQKGDYKDAVRIRRNISRLGVIMRDSARWAYEALFGTDLIFIAYTDAASSHSAGGIHNLNDWEKDASGFLKLLETTHRGSDLPLIRREIQICCDLRGRIDLARNDSSIPGSPPGIPLTPLFADWMAGVCILQQIATLLFIVVISAVCNRCQLQKNTTIQFSSYGVIALSLLCAIVSSGLLLFGVPTLIGAEIFISALISLIFSSLVVWTRYRSNISTDEVSTKEIERLIQSQWSRNDTTRSVLLLFLPGAVLLFYYRPVLSHLHPAAVLLSSVLSAGQSLTIRDSVLLALLTCTTPILLFVLSSVWSIRRFITPLTGLYIWIQRTAIPLILCLMLSYLVLISRTLSWDANASIAINQEAENDLQWVLTHSSEE